MTPLQTTVRAALAGAVADNIPDTDFRQVLSTIAEDSNRELDTAEAARILGKSEVTLKRWRCAGTGPRYRKDNSRFVRYRLSWLHEYMEQGEVVKPRVA